MARSYTKRSPYWNRSREMTPSQGQSTPAASMAFPVAQAAPMDVDPAFDGAPRFSAKAACGGGGVPEVALRDQFAPAVLNPNGYRNIMSGIVPLSTVEGNYSSATAINLCYITYFNYAVFRNAINLLTDFSVGRIHVKTENKRCKNFIETWFDAIGLNKLQAGSFLEYWRGGNVFWYKFSGKISDDGFNMLKESYAAAGQSIAKRSPTIPIRYTILNPMQVYLQRGASYQYGYVRMLSTYEIERLKNPQTDEDKQMFNSFPEDIQRQILQGGSWRWLFVPLDQNRLYYMFYRKQDYEPLAVPMGYPVLNDIEFKLELRRMDMALASTMEQVMMLVTAGRQADQFNLVTGAKTLATLQEIFQTQTVGRVLVADYTTKAEWIIPDFKNLLGPEKYARVDQDIKEGLQYMFFGEEKFANASVKIRIFIQTLKEARRAFIEDFLLPEVKKVCEVMNFKNIPVLEYEEIQIQDETLMNRLYVQLAQLGMLTPEETFTAMRTGMTPTAEESVENQTLFKGQKAKGLYAPPAPPGMGGGGTSAPNGRPPGSTGTPAPRQVATPIGQKKVGNGVASLQDLAGGDEIAGAAAQDRTESKYHFGMMKVADSLVKMVGLRDRVETALMKRFKVAALNDAQQMVAAGITKSLVFNEKEESWAKAIPAYVKAPKDLPSEVTAELAEIGAEFEVTPWIAAVLARSKVDFTPSQA